MNFYTVLTWFEIELLKHLYCNYRPCKNKNFEPGGKIRIGKSFKI